MRLRSLGLLGAVLAAACGGSPAGEGDGRSVDVVFLGDTSFGERYVEPRAYFAETGYDRYRHPLADVAALLAPSDLVIANLETTLGDVGPSPLAGKKGWLHRGDAERVPAALRDHGVTAVSLANNHSMDYGAAGLLATRAAVERRGIAAFGAGRDAAEATAPWITHLDLGDRSLELAVFGAFEQRRSAEAYHFYAGDGETGVAVLPDTVARIRDFRAGHPDAFVVAFVHWGRNYAWRTGGQRADADALVAAGADLVVGHGAHVIQEFERRSGHWVLYSLGNYVFVSLGRFGRLNAHPYGAVARLTLRSVDGRLQTELRLYPIFIDNVATGYRPRRVSLDEFRQLLALLHARGADLAGAESGRDERGPFLRLSPAGRPR